LFLVLRHACDIVSERSSLITGLGGVEAKELSKSLAVLRVFVNSELDVLAEGRVKLVKLLSVFSDFVEQLEGLLDNVLADHLHDLVLLECLTREVQRKVLGINNTLDEAEPLWDEIGGIVSDEDAADVKLDVVLGLLRLEEVERCSLRNEEDSAEFELTFNGEVLDGKMVFPIVGKRLVE